METVRMEFKPFINDEARQFICERRLPFDEGRQNLFVVAKGFDVASAGDR